MVRTGARTWLLACAALAALTSPIFAQDYPTKPVRLIVPLGAGGPTDIVGRWLAQALSEQLKQTFFVDNRPGAAGVIGTVEAARAAPDGYTLLIAASPHINLEILNTTKPYQLMRDFVAVAPAFSYESLMVVHPSVPANNLKEFIALAKAKPGQLNYGSSGHGSSKHMAGELFKLMSETNLVHVAYKGSTGARNDILGGHVQMMFDEIPAVGPNVIAKQVRALGSTGSKRSATFPDLPTLSEAGLPGYEHTGWSGVMAPAGTPKRIVDLLNAEINKVLAKPGVKETWVKQGADIMTMTPEAYDAFMRADLEKWTKVIKAANIKIE